MSDTLATLNRLQRLEEQHAGLAAKVDRLSVTSGTYTATVDGALTKQIIELSLRLGELEDKFRVSDDVTDRRIAALESPAPAPDRVQCPVCGEMVNEESLVTGVWEGEARCNCPAPDPVCATCEGMGKRYTNGLCEDCNGTGFVPTAEPAPLDPVLVLTDSEVEMLREIVNARTSGTGGLIMSTQIDYREIAIGILGRAYGRDGAR